MIMTVTRISIAASRVANQVADVIAPALAASDCKPLPIVAMLPSGRVDIVDGYHRIAGLIAGGAETIDCLVCDDEDLVAAAGNAEDTTAQQAALEVIYAAA